MKGVLKMKKLLILIIAAVAVSIFSSKEEYVPIPSSSIRMRVIASSNSKKDQEEKIEVKSLLEEKLYDLTKNAKSIDEIDDLIIENQSSIDKYITEEMSNRNKKITLTSNYGLNYFPEKTYKGEIYKAGNYKSYVVTLGSGKGENWWCVLYPPLCQIDENVSDYEYHYLIKDALSKYN